MNALRATLFLASAVALVACGDDDLALVASGDPALNPHVETPADGDAVGAEFAGEWDLELVWTACSGTCAVDTVFGPSSVCDVGVVRDDRGEIAQTDGELQIDLDGEDLRFAGGANSDGTFDVLSVATQFGGALEIRVRAKGTITGETLAADASSHTSGQTDGGSLNCWGTVEISGTRRN